MRETRMFATILATTLVINCIVLISACKKKESSDTGITSLPTSSETTTIQTDSSTPSETPTPVPSDSPTPVQSSTTSSTPTPSPTETPTDTPTLTNKPESTSTAEVVENTETTEEPGTTEYTAPETIEETAPEEPTSKTHVNYLPPPTYEDGTLRDVPAEYQAAIATVQTLGYTITYQRESDVSFNVYFENHTGTYIGKAKCEIDRGAQEWRIYYYPADYSDPGSTYTYTQFGPDPVSLLNGIDSSWIDYEPSPTETSEETSEDTSEEITEETEPSLEET
ncbi:MAG: hypothetical protein IK020_10155 [Clostridiales bacterium]|nr:hypothetical protein [Clostridiales bacterium]